MAEGRRSGAQVCEHVLQRSPTPEGHRGVTTISMRDDPTVDGCIKARDGARGCARGPRAISSTSDSMTNASQPAAKYRT